MDVNKIKGFQNKSYFEISYVVTLNSNILYCYYYKLEWILREKKTN